MAAYAEPNPSYFRLVPVLPVLLNHENTFPPQVPFPYAEPNRSYFRDLGVAMAECLTLTTAAKAASEMAESRFLEEQRVLPSLTEEAKTDPMDLRRMGQAETF